VVVTNSLEIINIVSKIQGITVISTGGTLRTKSMSFQGQLTEYTIQKYNIHKAFISAKGVSLEEGVMDSNEFEAEIKRKMIDAAKEVILLADHTNSKR
jgi:DeoR/GlpR family transcriptional regulator of sugar metabolism